MGMGSTLGLLLEIGADPSQAEAALRRLQSMSQSELDKMQVVGAEVSGNLTQGLSLVGGAAVEAGNRIYEASEKAGSATLANREALVQLAEQGYAPLILRAEQLANSSEHAARATQQHAQAVSVLMPQLSPLNQAMSAAALVLPSYQEQLTAVGGALRGTVAPAYEVAAQAARDFGDTVVRSTQRTIEAHGQEMASEAARLAAGLGNRRAAAVVEAVWETAKGFAALAEYDFWGATQHFLSAAEYGIIAGTGGRGGSGGYGGGRTRGPSASSYGGEISPSSLTPAQQQALLAPGAAGALAGPAGNLTVMVMGEPNAAAYVANILNQHVVNRDGRLVASHARNPVTVSR
jgi:hypothetical protein